LSAQAAAPVGHRHAHIGDAPLEGVDHRIGTDHALASPGASQPDRPAERRAEVAAKLSQAAEMKMVGVARIELATPAMSTRAASANLLIFRCSA
jgi:hypothetical protein